MFSNRFIITDAQWALIEPHCMARNAIRVALVATAVFSWRRSCGLPELARLGATCRPSLATGTPFSSASVIGSKPMFSNGYLTPYLVIPTWNAS